MKRIPRASAAVAALIGAFALSFAACTSDVAPTAPKAPAITARDLAPNDLLGVNVGGTLKGVLSLLNLFQCETPNYGSVTQTVGRGGGTINVGPHSLYIPKGALTGPVSITATAREGALVKVDFQPEGLRFGRPAVLTMSYAHCSSRPKHPRIVYVTDDLQTILEALPSVNDKRKERVTAKLDHFSGYAFAD
jgi:hypothetical protein